MKFGIYTMIDNGSGMKYSTKEEFLKLTAGQEGVEKAFLAFKNIQITPEFRKEMEKLAKALNPVSVGSIFKVIKKLKKLIEDDFRNV